MNRNEEFSALLAQLEDTPPALEYTLVRARARRKKLRTIRAFLAPLGSLATVFAVFAIMINLSPAFAQTVSRVPFLKELAEFVSISNSLSSAVENDYVQLINQEQAQDDVAAKIEYVIVDQKQLNIFYSLSSDEYSEMDASAGIFDTEGNALDGYFLLVPGGLGVQNGELRHMILTFGDEYNMPDGLILELSIIDNSEFDDAPYGDERLPEYEGREIEFVASFRFTLEFDPYYTAQGKVLKLNRSFTIDGQTLILVSAEIYPTHMRLNFDADEHNTAWLKSLNFYIENEKGEKLGELGSSGLHSSGAVDSPMMKTYFYDSPYFSSSKHLTLCISGARWLDKDKERIYVDLANKSAEWLPEGINFDSAERSGNGWILEFSGTADPDYGYMSIWNCYYGPDGEQQYAQWESMTGPDMSQSDGKSEPFWFTFPLANYPHDEVWLEPIMSHKTVLDEALRIKIK